MCLAQRALELRNQDGGLYLQSNGAIGSSREVLFTLTLQGAGSRKPSEDCPRLTAKRVAAVITQLSPQHVGEGGKINRM